MEDQIELHEKNINFYIYYMTYIEDMKLPQPIKVKPSIARYLDDLEEKGNTIFGRSVKVA